jgi:signal transduction histidine kinase
MSAAATLYENAPVGYAMRIRSFPTLLQALGLLVWLGICATTVLQAEWTERLAVWAVASVSFALAFWRNASRARAAPVEMLVQAVAVVVMVGLLCNGFEGFLLVLLAAQLGLWGRMPYGALWVTLEALAIGVAIGIHWSPRSALLLVPPYFGFGLLMFAATRLLREEAETRANLATVNDELTRAQAEVKRATRLDERLRIAQNLHDSLGHHLTALSLNLEAAAHSSPGAAAPAIRTAQDLARTSLSEIRTLVQEAKEDRAIDLERELQQLAQDLPRPRLHVTCAVPLAGLEPEVARILLQSVQEVTTNSIRHGAASNLWIEIERRTSDVALLARDDGRGTNIIQPGFGLAGIRRRVEALGGSVRLGSTAGQGFEVQLQVPCTVAVLPT